jgi:threonine dehydratase
MPSDAPKLKRMRTEQDGAEVVTVGNDSDERARKADEIAKQQGLTPVPPYNHPLIAAGQGTAALELIEDAKQIDRFYAPVSGGGLMSGCATAVRALCPKAEIVGVEPEDANDTKLSLQKGERVKIAPPQTIADGLRVRTPGDLTWPVIRSKVDRIDTVSDREMLEAMAYAIRELRLILEPSGAASLALAMRERLPGRNGVLLSGGNVDPEVLAQAFAIVDR